MNEDIYVNDIENRFPTFTLTKSIDGSLTIFELKDGSTIIARARGAGAGDVVFKLRSVMVGGVDILPILTPTQRDSLTDVIEGQQIIVLDAGVRREQFYNGTVWKDIGSGGNPAGATQAQAYATSTQTLTSSTFTKLTGTTTFLSSADFDDDEGTAMAIRYIGAAPANVLVHYQARAASIDTNNAAMNLKLALNGIVQDPSLVSGQTDKNIQPDTSSGNFILSLVQNDVIEMQGNRQSGAQDIDIFELVIIAVKL